jgi:CHAD domain-containing protein
MSTSTALSTVLAHNLNTLSVWQNKARTWDDTEGVHQVRISFRRLRSALNIFRPILTRDVRLFWTAKIKELADLTNMARDIDVLIEEGLPAFQEAYSDERFAGEERFNIILHTQREAAYKQVRAMLDSGDFGTFMRDFPIWIDSQGWSQGDLPHKKRKRQTINIVTMGKRLLDKQDSAVREFGHTVNPENTKEMHRLRIACKKLRYASEFFFPVIEGLDTYLQHLKGLQDILGIMHDSAIIKDLLENIMPSDLDSDINTYIRGLVDWRTHQYQAKRGTFADQWAIFEQATRPWAQDDF